MARPNKSATREAKKYVRKGGGAFDQAGGRLAAPQQIAHESSTLRNLLTFLGNVLGFRIG